MMCSNGNFVDLSPNRQSRFQLNNCIHSDVSFIWRKLQVKSSLNISSFSETTFPLSAMGYLSCCNNVQVYIQQNLMNSFISSWCQGIWWWRCNTCCCQSEAQKITGLAQFWQCRCCVGDHNVISLGCCHCRCAQATALEMLLSTIPW
jgi:hypothetical protein